MKKVLFACLIFSFSLALASGQSITVTKPAANETWVKGQSHTIQWTKQGTLPDTVRISLRDSGGTALVQLIANAAPNTGTFSWTVPSTLADGAYRIKVKATDVAIEALSGIFTIGSSSEGLHPRLKAVRKGTLNLQVAPSVKVLKPSSGDAYHQLDTITIQVQANTGPADGSGDGFDLDLYNETGTARVTDILSGAMTQTSPGVYSFAWAMPRMDSVPDGRYTIRARSWNRNITGLSAPFWIRIPGAEEKIAVAAVIDNSWSYKKEPSGSAPAEHVAAERPGEARIGWYNSAGDGGTPYTGVVYRARMQFPMDSLKARLPRFSKASLRLKQTSFGVRHNVGDLHWTIGKLMVLNAPWSDFWDTPSTYFKEVPTNAGAEWTCDVTSLVRDWLSGAKPNHGLLVTAHSETWLHIFQYAVSFYKGTIELTFFQPVY
jgi:hypothetical protein